jgi:hypothetical protein
MGNATPQPTELATATGTWSLETPVNFFASATYVVNGKRLELPVEVAGDKITGEFRETGRSQQ